MQLITKEQAYAEMSKMYQNGMKEEEVIKNFIGKVKNLRNPDSTLRASTLQMLLKNGNTMNPTSNRSLVRAKGTKNMDMYHLRKDIKHICQESKWTSETKIKMILAVVEN